MLFFAVSCDSDSGDGNNNLNNNNNNSGDLCGGKCEAGQYCWNGICVNGCTSDSHCDANKYCDIDSFTNEGHCANKVNPGCSSDSDCESTQTCVSGACAVKTTTSTGCKWEPNMTDGCGQYELCYIEDGQDTGTCYTFPPCNQDGSCAVGMGGAVCNDGYLTTKAKICLPGMCKEAANCPDKYKCDTSMGGPLGFCFPDIMGGCEDDTDCEDGEECEMGQCILTSMGW